jgi:hyperosmotically inducible protein
METINYLKLVAGVACIALSANLSAQVNNAASSSADAPLASTSPAHESIRQDIDDIAITTKVKFSLLTAKNFGSAHVQVGTQEGVVRLTGTVPSAGQKSTATDVAQTISGVRSVENDLLVGQ